MSLEEDKKLISINDCNVSDDYTILDCRGIEIKVPTSFLKENSEYFDSLFSRWNNESLKKNKDGYPIVYLFYDSQTVHSLLNELNNCNLKDFLCIKKEEKIEEKEEKTEEKDDINLFDFKLIYYKFYDNLVDFWFEFELLNNTVKKSLSINICKSSYEEDITCQFHDLSEKYICIKEKDSSKLLEFSNSDRNLEKITKENLIKERCKTMFHQYFYKVVKQYFK
jgi:hypothetical protein